MQVRFFVEVLSRKPEINGDRAMGIGGGLSERLGLGLGLPGDLALGVGGEFWRAEMIGLEDMDLPGVSADLGLPEGEGTKGGVGLPAVGAGEVALIVEFGDQSFVGVEGVGGVAVDGFGDAPAEGVVAVGGAFLTVLGDLAQAVGGVVGVVGVVVLALFSGELAGGAVGVGGLGVALAVVGELVIGVVVPGAGLVGAALPVVDGIVAVAFERETLGAFGGLL